MTAGLFSIAYATTLAHGGEPERLTYNQNVIRKHLYHYLKNGKLTQFPSKHCTEISASTIFKIEIHCHCRMPELKQLQ